MGDRGKGKEGDRKFFLAVASNWKRKDLFRSLGRRRRRRGQGEETAKGKKMHPRNRLTEERGRKKREEGLPSFLPFSEDAQPPPFLSLSFPLSLSFLFTSLPGGSETEKREVPDYVGTGEEEANNRNGETGIEGGCQSLRGKNENATGPPIGQLHIAISDTKIGRLIMQ